MAFFLPSAARRQYLSLEVAILLAGGGPGAFGEHAAQPPIPSVGSASLVLSRTTAVARAHSSPRTQVAVRRENPHICSHLCQDTCCRIFFHSGYGLEQFKGSLEASFEDLATNLLIDFCNLVLQENQMLDAEANQLSMVFDDLQGQQAIRGSSFLRGLWQTALSLPASPSPPTRRST